VSGFWAGLSLGFSLILAIGAQNAFVLRQGLKKEYIFSVCFICSLSDALLIALGVSGFAFMLAKMPWINPVVKFGGALFLFIYGVNSFWAAYKNNESLLPSKNEKSSLFAVTLTCLAFTWLNPHVYLDTVMLLGSISTQYTGQKIQFALGAIFASFVFFFALGYGARALTPIFNNSTSWKILDLLIGCIMWCISFSLIKEQLFSLVIL